MGLIRFLASAVAISMSGVMAPGPMTTVTVHKGRRSPHAGALVALGHGAIEVPIMVLIYAGLGSLFDIPGVTTAIAALGGVLLIVMAVAMVLSLKRDPDQDVSVYPGSAVLAGMALSIGNPYFLLWWATVGAALTSRASRFGLLGFTAFAVVHWLCDMVWYYFLSIVVFKTGTFLGPRFHRTVTLTCGIVLVWFGVAFIIAAIRDVFL